MYAFVDEFGEASLNVHKQGVTEYFVLAAVLVDDDKLSAVRDVAEEIRSRNFQTGEISSKQVADKHKRRIKILSNFRKLDVKYRLFVVDKQAIYSVGLRHRDTFHKYLHQQFYHSLLVPFPHLEVTADERGNEEFKASLRAYIERKCALTTDGQYEWDFGFGGVDMPVAPFKGTFELVSSADEVMVQIADFIAGTAGRCFGKKFESNYREVFAQQLRDLCAHIEHWPHDQSHRLSKEVLNREGIDPQVYELSVSSAEAYIRRFSGETDERVQSRVSAAKYLLTRLFYGDPFDYVQRDELIKQIAVPVDVVDEVRFLRQNVVAMLREANVPVVAHPAGGYKLASRIEEVRIFFVNQMRTIVPMIERLGRYATNLNLKSNGRIDLLASPPFALLSAAYDSLQFRGLALSDAAPKVTLGRPKSTSLRKPIRSKDSTAMLRRETDGRKFPDVQR